MLLVFQQMLNLGRHVVTDAGKLPMKFPEQLHRVTNPIEKIRIAEGDMLSPLRYLLANIFEHSFAIYDSEDSVIDGDDRAVPAQVFAAPARFRVAGHTMLARWQDDVGVF